MVKINFVNLFSLSYDAINGMEKKDSVSHIDYLKRKVMVGNNIQVHTTIFQIFQRTMSDCK